MIKKRFTIALVGRPNVGKSSLFNRLCGKRVAIVDELEGVTRDRLYFDVEVFGKKVTLIDTGGIDPRSKIPFQEEIRAQTEKAIEEAHLLIHVVDGKVGPTHIDEELARLLLHSKKKIFLAVNKCDEMDDLERMYEFYALGISNVYPLSAVHGHKVADLLQACLSEIPEEEVELKDEKQIKVCIVGKPNVGKSTLLNQIMQEERSIVSPIPGTTRDHIDCELQRDGTSYLFIDTAGIRKKKAEHETVDKYAAIRTENAIDRSDLCVLLIDAEEGLGQREKRIIKMVEEKGKGFVLFINKWDLIKGFRMEHVLRALKMEVPFLNDVPIVVGSALKGRNISKIFDHVKTVYQKLHLRISTGKLNRFMEDTIQKYHPPMIEGRRLRIYYLTQVDILPPHFILFVNYPKLMTPTYKKYLINQLREKYNLIGCPFRFDLKKRSQRKIDWSDKEKESEQEFQTLNF